MVERGGKLESRTIENTRRKIVIPLVVSNVKKGSQIFTDEYLVYKTLHTFGFKHDTFPHAEKIYVLGNCHTNTIEGFLSLIKNGIRGVYHSVSSKYLQ